MIPKPIKVCEEITPNTAASLSMPTISDIITPKSVKVCAQTTVNPATALSIPVIIGGYLEDQL